MSVPGFQEPLRSSEQSAVRAADAIDQSAEPLMGRIGRHQTFRDHLVDAIWPTSPLPVRFRQDHSIPFCDLDREPYALFNDAGDSPPNEHCTVLYFRNRLDVMVIEFTVLISLNGKMIARPEYFSLGTTGFKAVTKRV